MKSQEYYAKKFSNDKSIKVLYKKVECIPEVKTIKHITNLKRMIIKQNLEIVPYSKCFIICYNQKIKT